jgi:ATP-dependent Clp protease protease subunit
MARNNSPIRCFDGQAKPHEAFWRIRNAANGEPELEFYGFISEYSWLGDEITPAKFKDDLYKVGNGGPVTVRINSAGGDPIAASVIRAIMSDYPGPITVQIDGLAASAAVIVAMAGSTVRIMDTAYMMIHDPAVVVVMAALDIETLGLLRDELKSIKQGIVDTYVARTGLSQDRVAKMMADETWMGAQEAVSLGFATEVVQGGQKPANRAYMNALLNYANVPPALLASQQPEAVREEDREAQSLIDDIDLIV